jgi:transposase
LKCGSLPAKADVREQRTFYDSILAPLIKSAQNNESVLLFMDASHFVMGGDFLGYIYGKVRRFIKTFSGRKRYNVLGALNFVSKKVATVTNETYITSCQVIELLCDIALEYAGKPIRVILDNASYQKCYIVQHTAVALGIELVYIPSYSPNLNLVERLWKFVKNQLRTKYYDDFDIFKERIDSIVSSTDNYNKNHIDSLIGDKVQLFDDVTVSRKYSLDMIDLDIELAA